MRIHTAASAGFCFGVARAVDTVTREMTNKRLVTLGSLIHNKIVTDNLTEKGVRIINSPDEAGGAEVVIRSHGVHPSVEKEMKAKGIAYIDCTCPCVKTVHRRAAEAREKGRVVIIMGEEKHPEVAAHIGYAGDGCLVFDNAEDLLKSVKPGVPYTLIAQTTFNREVFKHAADVLVSAGIDVEIFDTVCDATSRRQAETEALSKRMDVMLVLGDKASANTNNLYQISQKYCERTLLLAQIRDLQLQYLHAGDNIGITAGASTPPFIIKEAIQFMSDIASAAQQASAQPSQSFEEMLNESLVALHNGDIVKGTVIQVTSSEVTMNLGYKSDGIITRAEMTDDPAADITQLVKPGDVFDVFVLRVNDGDGNVQVSKKRLDNQIHYKKLEEAFTSKTPLPGKVTEVVKGGLIALIENCRVFIPSSQASNRYVEDLSIFKGRELNFNILEFDRSKRRIVGGRKELATIEQKQRREELFATLEPGQRLEGVVSRIVEFGAFIDIGGVDGLVHISELAWRRVRKVTDILQVGDHVTVTVIDINTEKNKISLTLKDINNDPWNNIADKYPLDSIVEGKVVRLTPFGAFIMLEDGVDGLVHISQIANRHVVKPEDELTVGETISVMVTDIDEENHKISLSKREADLALGIPDRDDEYTNEEPDEYADGEREAEDAGDTAESGDVPEEADEPVVEEEVADNAPDVVEESTADDAPEAAEELAADDKQEVVEK